MAETFLHIEIARALHRTTSGLSEIVTPHEPLFRLGSVAHDLAYFDRVLVSGVRRLRHQPEQYHPFGQQIHQGGTQAMCTWMVENAKELWQKAFTAGVLSHFATDVVFHREIESRIAGTSISHGALEEQLCLFCYYDLLRNSGVGTLHFTKSYMMFPMEPWGVFWTDSLSQLYIDIPPVSQFDRWLGAMRVFGLLHFSKHLPWVTTVPNDDPDLSQLSLDLLDTALNQSNILITAALNYWNGDISRKELHAHLPQNRISDGLADS